MRPAYPFLLAPVVVLAAINADGSRAVVPLSEDDPSPVGDILTYVPDQHDCPLPCSIDYAIFHKWTPYYSVHRLRRCELPMLLHFSVLLPLNNPNTDLLIRSCTIGTDPASVGDRTVINATSIPIDNPKNGTNLFEISRSVAPACAVDGRETTGELTITTSGGQGSSREFVGLLDGIEDFFKTKDNCDEAFLFAYHKTTVASIYIGAGLGMPTVTSALQAMAGRFEASDSITNRTVAQLCGGGHGRETIFGLSVDITGDIVGIQKSAVSWSQGSCVVGDDIVPLSIRRVLRSKSSILHQRP